MTLDQLNAKFALPHGALTLTTGEGGLPCVDIASTACTARIYLHGAHLTHWQPTGTPPVLWMSGKSLFTPGKPIRGGVPICFPWFGPKADDPQAPAHGFVRTLPWELEATRLGDAGKVALVLLLKSNAHTRALWPHEFELRHRITCGHQLIMKLELTNTGPTPLTFQEALHTYLAVGDVRQAQVHGLDGTDYLDKTDKMAQKRQHGPVTITAETDRVYLDTQPSTTLEDPVLHRRIRLDKLDSRHTVVWNPWVAKAQAMPDFGDDEWPGMLCVETANTAQAPVTVPPGAIHQMRATISVTA